MVSSTHLITRHLLNLISLRCKLNQRLWKFFIKMKMQIPVKRVRTVGLTMRILQIMSMLQRMKYSTVKDQYLTGEEVKIEILEITVTKGMINQIAREDVTPPNNGEGLII